MTNVLIEYNPFKENTKICIDGIEISSTSGLYKYISTPLQDWVADLFQILTEHCNDDQLCITFKGLQYSCDLLEEEYEKFEKNNREYDIDLSFDVSKSELARFGMISNMMDELKNQRVSDELNDSLFDILEKNSECKMNVYVIGGTDEHRHDLVDAIVENKIERNDESIGYIINNCESITLGHKDDNALYIEYDKNLSFLNSRYCSTKIYEIPNLDKCKNAYYRIAKESLVSDEKPVVIYILESNNRYNNAEFLNLISDEYNKKGVMNKSRFIFVSEAPKDGQKILNSYFAIKKATILDFSCIKDIHNRLETYQTQVCMIKYITNVFTKLNNNLDCFEKRLSLYTEKKKNKNSDIDELENEAVSLLDEVFLTYSINYVDQEKCINDFKNEMIDIFKKEYIEKIDFLEYSDEEYTKQLMLRCILNHKELIKKQFEKEAEISNGSFSISINENIRPVLTEIKCIENFERILNEWNDHKIKIFEYEYPDKEKFLSDIVKDKKDTHELIYTYTEMLAMNISSISSICRRILQTEETAWKKYIEMGKKKFGEYFDSVVTCQLKAYFDECNNELMKKYAVMCDSFNKEICEFEKTIKQHADMLRQEVQKGIMQDEMKKRLDYLKDEINKLIEL